VCKVSTRPFLRLPTTQLSEPFLDDELRRALPELELNQCPQCLSLWTVDGRREQSLLLRAYARIPDSYFGEIHTDPRYARFYSKLGSVLAKHTHGRRLCDVGCGEGSFLASLGSEWERWGIEPSCCAVESVKSKGLRAVCGTLESVSEPRGIDVLTAQDVIEHVANPAAFLMEARKRLAEAGLLVLVTGDPSSLTARIAGPHWSYLRWCGHVSVMSGSALRQLLNQNGYEVAAWMRTSHPASAGAAAWWRVLLLEPLRRLLGRAPSWYPFWRDHQIVVARVQPL
jgi:SAM-dependent methyltransferase